MSTILIATRNAHKVGEIKGVLGGQFTFLTLNDFPGAPGVVEDAPTFAGNAVKKALGAAQWLAKNAAELAKERASLVPPLYVLADDSGLEVDALDGAPGVRSARFASEGLTPNENASDAANNAKLLRLLGTIGAENRTARFRCVIALAPVIFSSSNRDQLCYADPVEFQTEIFEGSCEGRIIEVPRGEQGFGYDPLFVPENFKETYAELGESTKNRISHRARALMNLKARLCGKGQGE